MYVFTVLWQLTYSMKKLTKLSQKQQILSQCLDFLFHDFFMKDMFHETYVTLML